MAQKPLHAALQPAWQHAKIRQSWPCGANRQSRCCTADPQRTLNLARQGQALRVLRSLDVMLAWWVGQDLQAAEQPKPNSRRLRVKVGHYENRSCSRDILLGYSPIHTLKSTAKQPKTTQTTCKP
jgi:hypothetical protein